MGPYSLVYLVVVRHAADMEEENRSNMLTTAVYSRDILASEEEELHHQPSEVRGSRRLFRQMTKLAIREVGGNR